MSSFVPEELAKLAEFGEAEAFVNTYLCTSAEFAEKLGVRVVRVGSAWVVMIPGLNSAFFNRIMCLGVSGVAEEAVLDDAIAALQTAGCKTYMVQLSPLAQPSQIGERLEQRGFNLEKSWAKLYRGNEPATAVRTDLRVEAVRTGQDQNDFTDVALSAFEMSADVRPWFDGAIGQPGWYHYLGFAEDQPVSTAAMFVSGEVGWLGSGSTLRSHRRRGGQSALLARRIEDGRKLGCRWFVAETSEDTPELPNPSYRNMIGVGFKLAYLRPNYLYVELEKARG